MAGVTLDTGEVIAASRNERRRARRVPRSGVRVLAAHAPGRCQGSHRLRAALVTLLWLQACGTTTTPSPVATQPAVPASPEGVAHRPAEPPAEPPESTDLCTDDGWCRPFVAMVIDSVAATTEAVAVATEAGTVALWADGRWRGGFLGPPGVEVRAVERFEGGIRILTCRGRDCEGRTWTSGAFSDATAESDAPAAPPTAQRLGAWEVEYSTLVRTGDSPLRLRPITALGGEQCASAFGILGDALNPFAL